MAGREAPKNGKKANAVKNLEYGKMVKIERRLRSKILKDPGPKPPEPPPSLRGALYGASETQEPMGARSSSNESLQHQGPPGAREREAGGGGGSRCKAGQSCQEKELPEVGASNTALCAYCGCALGLLYMLKLLLSSSLMEVMKPGCPRNVESGETSLS